MITVSLKNGTSLTCNVKVKSQEEAGVKEVKLYPVIDEVIDTDVYTTFKITEGMTWEDLYDAGWNSDFILARVNENDVAAFYQYNNKLWILYTLDSKSGSVQPVSKDDVISAKEILKGETTVIYILYEAQTT